MLLLWNTSIKTTNSTGSCLMAPYLAWSKMKRSILWKGFISCFMKGMTSGKTLQPIKILSRHSKIGRNNFWIKEPKTLERITNNTLNMSWKWRNRLHSAMHQYLNKKRMISNKNLSSNNSKLFAAIRKTKVKQWKSWIMCSIRSETMKTCNSWDKWSSL